MLLLAGGAAAQEPSTAIVVQPIDDAHAVLGDDGKTHVDYDLMVTNVWAGPVTLEAVEVTGPDGATLARLEGDALKAATLGLLLATPVMPVPVNGAVAVEVDLALEPGQVPETLGHRVTYSTPDDDPLASMLGTRVIDGPEVGLSGREAVSIRAPLTGAGWATLNGCCVPNLHRSLRIAAGTRIAKSEVFAIDWVRLEDGRFYEGDGSRNAQYPSFGAEVRAVADGEVVARRDGMAESTPGQPPTTLEAPQDYAGNALTIRIAPDVYAVYAHLQPGSLTVAVGDRVAAGELLGRVGNSGNSTAPHLHFGLLDSPDILTGTSLPFVIEDLEVTGAVTGGVPPVFEVTPASRPVAAGYPLVGSVATFR